VERSRPPTDDEFEALCARHPELALELRALNKTRWLLDELGRDRPPARTAPKSAGEAHDEEIPKLEGFQLLQRLGRGGMGEVWEAFELALHRRVAIKLLAPLSSHSDRERLRREALAAARLRHPNVVALFSSSEHAGRPFLVQELIAGGRTLRDEIEELRRLGSVPEGYERKIAERFVALADALELAHSAGVVHRDIKPQNILLEADGRPKLADFGLAKTVGDASLSVTGEFVGTYLYASPEQVAAMASIGPASDRLQLGRHALRVPDAAAAVRRRQRAGDHAHDPARRPAIPARAAPAHRPGPLGDLPAHAREAAGSALREHGSAA
jgi:serine/threonine-protein kinase